MIKTNSLNKNEANTGCKRDTPQIETKEEEEEEEEEEEKKKKKKKKKAWDV